MSVASVMLHYFQLRFQFGFIHSFFTLSFIMAVISFDFLLWADVQTVRSFSCISSGDQFLKPFLYQILLRFLYLCFGNTRANITEENQFIPFLSEQWVQDVQKNVLYRTVRSPINYSDRALYAKTAHRNPKLQPYWFTGGVLYKR